jgi:hypothetical protein
MWWYKPTILATQGVEAEASSRPAQLKFPKILSQKQSAVLGKRGRGRTFREHGRKIHQPISLGFI